MFEVVVEADTKTINGEIVRPDTRHIELIKV